MRLALAALLAIGCSPPPVQRADTTAPASGIEWTNVRVATAELRAVQCDPFNACAPVFPFPAPLPPGADTIAGLEVYVDAPVGGPGIAGSLPPPTLFGPYSGDAGTFDGVVYALPGPFAALPSPGLLEFAFPEDWTGGDVYLDGTDQIGQPQAEWIFSGYGIVVLSSMAYASVTGIGHTNLGPPSGGLTVSMAQAVNVHCHLLLGDGSGGWVSAVPLYGGGISDFKVNTGGVTDYTNFHPPYRIPLNIVSTEDETPLAIECDYLDDLNGDAAAAYDNAQVTGDFTVSVGYAIRPSPL